jgi:hypothetical protein
VPDGGATPQLIIGLLMVETNKNRGGSIEVIGHLDSVSTTNTTSKKPGDIIERINADSELIYEITVKAFTDDRLLESYEAVMSYDDDFKDVFVICRPSDVPETAEKISSSFVMAITQHKKLTYYFINIYDYIQSSLLFITPSGRAAFYNELITYINKTNTSEKVKKYFKQWHDENLSHI